VGERIWPNLLAVLLRGEELFRFAPRFHSGLRPAGVPRRETGTPTFFNVLGPLTNRLS